MEALIATVSVIASAVVAVVVAVAAQRADAARLRYQIASERLDELRGVLDEAAMALKGALFEMNGVVSLLDQGLGGGAAADDVYPRFQDRYWEVSGLEERIALRLGPDAELTRVYRLGLASCHAFFGVWVERSNGRTWDADLSRRANEASANGELAHRQLLTAAAAIVGPRLGDVRA